MTERCEGEGERGKERNGKNLNESVEGESLLKAKVRMINAKCGEVVMKKLLRE